MATKRKKHKSMLDRYLIFCIVFFVLYTITEMLVSSITGVAHDTLTDAVKLFCGGEVFLCCMIKRLKLKKGDSNNEVDY